MNKNRIKIVRILVVLLFVAMCFVFTITNVGNMNIIALDNGDSTAYKTTQSEIQSYTYNTNTNYLSISSFYTMNGNNITENSLAPTNSQIITIKDEYELYAFSYLSSLSNQGTPNRFLNYTYELLCSIDYGTASAFIPIGLYEPFTGHFNGNGYDIINLRFIAFEEDILIDNTIDYMAMFAKNSGLLEDFGIINADMVQNITISTVQGIGIVAGVNTSSGIIRNVFVQDLRDPGEEAGISAIGYQVSGFVFNNEGTINTCYSAYSTVLNYTIIDYIDFKPFITVQNNALNTNNVFFYDESITEIVNNEYVYNIDLFGDKRISTSEVVGEYVSTKAELRSAFSNLDGWYSNDTYIDDNFDIELPIRRGIEEVNSSTSGKEFNLNDIFDYAYFYELINSNSYFASSDITYHLTCDIDLTILPSYCFIYDDFISCNIIGDVVTSSIYYVNGTRSNHPTIYNPYIYNKINYLGFQCYGLFPLFEGTLSNINVYYNNVIEEFNPYSNETPITAVGLVVGILEGGLLNNVNAFGNINLKTGTSPYNFGSYYVGGIVGVASRGGSITNATVSGSINGMTHLNTNLSVATESGFISGNCIGGAVGYSLQGVETFSSILSSVNIIATEFNTTTDFKQYIGGIIGCGYTNSCNQLTNKGSISVGHINSTSYYGDISVSGIIGVLIGVNNRIYSIHNQGDISIDINENKDINVSGIANIDLLMTPTSSIPTTLLTTFYAKGLSNGSTIRVTQSLGISNKETAEAVNVNITNGLYINNSSGFTSVIDGLYNLNYYYNNNGNNIQIDTPNDDNQNIIAIDVAFLDHYAPCVVSNGIDINGLITLSNAYNFRDMYFTSENTIYFDNVLYSGCVLGKYMNLTDIRNEGNMDFTISHDATNTLLYSVGNYKKFVIVGVFEEVSSNCFANIIYNNGDIDFYLTDSVNSFIFNLYISGICYANRVTLTGSAYDVYDPLSNDYDNNKVGSLNNAINNGIITSTSTDFENCTYSEEEVWSANGQVLQAILYTAVPGGTGYIRGCTNISGVCSVNEYVITNTFNLGDITNINYIVDPTGDYSYVGDFEVNSGGITYINVGQYAQIKDSANNGVIKAINLSSFESSWTNSAGITTRNEKLENGSDYTISNGHASQLICFTINYGEIYSYNYCENVDSVSNEQHSKSAGIMALGLCSILNTVNYANIYGSEISSGIFGLVYFSKFENELSSTNNVVFANSINYGNIWGINKGAMSYLVDNQDNENMDKQTYDELVAMSYTNQNVYASIDLTSYVRNSYLGSLIGVANFNNNSNAQYIVIRYLINFCETIPLMGGEFGVADSVNPNVDSMVSTYYKFTNGVYYYDTFMDGNVVYAPLSTETDETGHIGVFSEDFNFRKAVEGRIVATETTDVFISDYFQFVAFTKINDSLLEKVGWRTIAYANAANEFASDVQSLVEMFKLYDSTSLNNLVTTALSNGTWVNNCNPDILVDLIASLIEDKNVTELQTLINSLFFTNENKNAITSEMRTNAINELLAQLNVYLANNDSDLRTYLNTLLFGNGTSYSSILARAISGEDDNYEAVKTAIESYFNELTLNELVAIGESYIDLLSSDNTIANSYLDDIDLVGARKLLIQTITDGIENSILLDIYKKLNISSTEQSKIAKMEVVLEKMTDLAKQRLYLDILANENNTINEITGIIDAISDQIDYYSTISSAIGVSIVNDNELTSSSNYLNVWNAIREDDAFETYLDSILPEIETVDGTTEKGLYGIATESRNTFQSLDTPAPDGRFVNNEDPNNNATLVFNFESIISPDTYYYGPFLSINSTRTAATKFTNSGGTTYNSTYTAIGSQNGSKQLVNSFISTNPQDIIDRFGSCTTTGTNPNTFVFYYDVENKQYVSISHFNAFGGSASSALMMDFDGCYLTDGSFISGMTNVSGGTGTYSITKDGEKITYNNASVTTYAAKIMGTDIVTNGPEGVKYYVRSDDVVGVYRCYDPYGTYAASYFTAKEAAFSVFTTQYIDYTANDLCKLDGILTGYNSSTIQSQDEIDLINFICENYLFSDGNSANTIKMIKKSLLSNSTIDNTFVNNFFEAIVTSNDTSILDGITVKDGLYVTDIVVLSDYLINNYEGTTGTDITIYGASNKDNFKEIISYLLDDSIGYYAYLYGLLNQNELTYGRDYVYNMIRVLKETYPTYTDTQISDIILSTDKDNIIGLLTNSNPLDISMSSIDDGLISLLTYSNGFVGTIDISEYNNLTYVFGAKATSSSQTITFTSNVSGKLNVVGKGNGTISLDYSGGTTNNILLSSTSLYDFDILNGYTYTLTCPINTVIYQINYLDSQNITINDNDESAYISYSSDWSRNNGASVTINTFTATSYMQSNGSQTITFNSGTITMTNPRIVIVLVAANGETGTISCTRGTNVYDMTSVDNGNEINSTPSTYYSSTNITMGSSYTYSITFSCAVKIYKLAIYRYTTSTLYGQWYNSTRNNYSQCVTTFATVPTSNYFMFNSWIKDNVNNNMYTDSSNSISFTNLPDNSYIDISASRPSTNVTLELRNSTNVIVGTNKNVNTTSATTYSYTGLSGGDYTLSNDGFVYIHNITIRYDGYISTINNIERKINDYIALDLLDHLNPTINSYSSELQVLYKYIYDDLVKNQLNIDDHRIMGTINSNVTYNGYTLNATLDNQISAINSIETISGVEFGSCLSLGGIGTSSYRSVSFDITDDSFVYIYAKSNSNNNISVQYNGVIYTKEVDSIGGCYVFSIPYVSGVSDCFIFSSTGDVSIYEIDVMADNTIAEYTTKFNTDYADFQDIEDIQTSFSTELDNLTMSYEGVLKCCLFEGTERKNSGETYSTTLRDTYYKTDFVTLLTLLCGIDFDYQNGLTQTSLWNVFTDNQVNELASLLGVADDTVLASYINDDDDFDSLNNVLNSLISGDNRIAVAIIDGLNPTLSSLTVDQKYLFATAYTSTNYNTIMELAQNNIAYDITDTELFSIVRSLDSQYQYYDVDGNLDNDKFETLMKKVNFNLATQGYGIYALASSHGILNGSFIPDNIVLNDINPNYELNNDGYYEIVSTPSADWRSEELNDDESTTNTRSVNHAFKVSMKQLKKSIATTIFDLTLINENGYILTTSNENIILDVDDMHGSVTFYVGGNLGNSITDNSVDYLINSYEISDKATLIEGYSTLIFNVDGTTILRVYAEDTDVYKDYTVNIIKTGDISLTFVSGNVDGVEGVITTVDAPYSHSISPSVLYSNGVITLNISTNNIANMTDLTQYLLIDNYTIEDNMFSLGREPIVDATMVLQDQRYWTGTATVVLNISSNLASGSHTIYLKFSDSLIYSMVFTKSMSPLAQLNNIVFDGVEIDFTSNHNQISYIQFGRYFSYSELTTLVDYRPQYVDSISISPLVSTVISASIILNNVNTTADNGVTVYTGGIVSYVITYVITSEDGNTTNTYTHTLVEVDPFASAKYNNEYITGDNYNKNDYVSIYKNGSVVDVNPNVDGELAINFERGNSPKYRINYNFDSFFVKENEQISEYLNVNETFEVQSGTVLNTSCKYYGFSVEFYNTSEIGDYEFALVYEATLDPVSWSGGETYRRRYVAPTITITKTKSTDAYMKKITFITEASKVSNLATLGSLEEIYASNYEEVSGRDERTYEYLKTHDEGDITSTSTYGISYLTSNALNSSEYYLVGTVSNANLDDYAPLFKTEEHASIYRYIIYNENRYLFVSFTYINTNNEEVSMICLVDESWQNVYELTESNTPGMLIGAIVTDANGIMSVEHNGNTYTRNPLSGVPSTSNVDLFMSFVGEPGADSLYYVDYIVYAEAYDSQVPSYSSCYKSYHIAVIDITNSIYFTFSIDDLTDSEYFINNPIYVSFVCYNSDELTFVEGLPSDFICSISGFATYNPLDGLFYLDNGYQALPYGYYYIYMDLPNGYFASYNINEDNKKNTANQLAQDQSYLPPASIITQRISLTMTIDYSDEVEVQWGKRIETIIQIMCQR